MSYRLDGGRVNLRDVGIMVSACWCDRPEFALDAVSGDTESSAMTVASTECVADGGSYLWFVAVVSRYPLSRVKRLTESWESCLPSDVWCYGSREDHEEESARGATRFTTVHSCLVLLLGCLRPYSCAEMDSVVQAGLAAVDPALVPKVAVWHCPAHVDGEHDLCFKAVARWVEERLRFVEAAGAGTAVNGLRRGVFGSAGVLRLLLEQFGSASRVVVLAKVAAKEMRDEERGIRPGGFAPVLMVSGQPGVSVYVEQD